MMVSILRSQFVVAAHTEFGAEKFAIGLFWRRARQDNHKPGAKTVNRLRPSRHPATWYETSSDNS